MKFGVALLPNSPSHKQVEDAQLAERYGFNHVLVPDYRLLRDVYCTLTLIASSTSTVKIGPCTTNPFTRHPAVTAAAMATLQEISAGRGVLALAQGGLATTKPLGLSRTSSKDALRDAITIIRGLLRNEPVTHSGIIRAQSAKLAFEAAKFPIYMAATGPSMLKLAGELADGVLVNVGVADDQLEFALTHFEAGAKLVVNRSILPFKACWILGCSISKNRDDALRAAKPRIALLLANLPDEVLKASHVEPSLRSEIKRLYYSVGGNRAAELVTNSMVRRFTIAGTSSDAAKEFERVSSFGFDEVIILPGWNNGMRRASVIETVGREIIPSFS